MTFQAFLRFLFFSSSVVSQSFAQEDYQNVLGDPWSIKYKDGEVADPYCLGSNGEERFIKKFVRGWEWLSFSEETVYKFEK